VDESLKGMLRIECRMRWTDVFLGSNNIYVWDMRMFK
jgi:hypothetical protein